MAKRMLPIAVLVGVLLQVFVLRALLLHHVRGFGPAAPFIGIGFLGASAAVFGIVSPGSQTGPVRTIFGALAAIVCGTLVLAGD